MEGTFTAGRRASRGGDDVKVAGVKVGRVTGIHADREAGLVRVEWVINSGVDIREDAEADIALETLLGSKFIRITERRPRASGSWPTCPASSASSRTRSAAATACAWTAPPRPRTCSTSPARPPSGSRRPTTSASTSSSSQLAEITEGKRATVTDLINGIGDVSTADHRARGQAGRPARPGRRAGRQPGGQGPDPRPPDRQLAGAPRLPRAAARRSSPRRSGRAATRSRPLSRLIEANRGPARRHPRRPRARRWPPSTPTCRT